MKQNFSLLFRSKNFWFWIGTITLTTLFVSRIPLLATLGYEFSLLMALLTSLAAGFTTINMYYILEERNTFSAFSRAWRLNLLYVFLPLLLLLSSGGKSCGILEGIELYFLMPFLSVLYATGWGLAWRRIFHRPFWAGMAFTLFVLFSITLTVVQSFRHPPLFAYNHFFGYFAGPIYDEVVSIRPSFLIYRGMTLLHVVVLLCFLIVLERKQEGIWQRLRSRQATAILLACSVLLLALLYLYQGELGIFTTRSYLQQVLAGRYETPHFLLFYPPHSPVEEEIVEIARDHEFRYSQLAAFLQVSPSPKLVSYIYESPEQKKKLIGAGRTMIADPFNLEMHLNYRPFPHPVLKHELTHLLSTFFAPPFLRINPNMGLVEGIAEAATWESGELTPHQWSRAMIRLGIAPPVTEILRPWSFWLELPSRSYILTGSFIRYLIDTYGIERFKTLYQGASFEQSYGKDMETLNKEWQAVLQNISLSPVDLALARAYFDAPPLVQRSCGHEVARLKSLGWEAQRKGSFAEAAQYFAAAQQWNPGEPESWRGLLISWYAGKRYSETLALSDTMLGEGASLFQQLYTRNIRGDLFWEKGERTRARQEFHWIYTHAPSLVYRRLATIKLAALDQPGGERIRYALTSYSNKEEVLLQLRALVSLAPTFAPAYYLLGRHLMEKRLYEEATSYLRKAERLGLAEESLRMENNRLLGIALYHQGKYQEAQDYFQQVAESSQLEGVRNEAWDWIARCQWEETQGYGAG